MKLLFIGDSITKGSVAVSFVKKIQSAMPSSEIKNLGENGETLNCIAYRLLKELDNGTSYDRIIIQAGYNDLLLPFLLSKGKLFRFAYKIQLRKRMHPLRSVKAFEDFYSDVIEQVKRKSKIPIVLTTIGPLNEWNDNALNQKRLEYNESIRRLANRYTCSLADTALACEKLLIKKKRTNYLLNKFWNTLLFDRLFCRIPGVSCSLSRRRKLHLTIDGVHLNKFGALIFSRVVIDAIHAPVHSIQTELS